MVTVANMSVVQAIALINEQMVDMCLTARVNDWRHLQNSWFNNHGHVVEMHVNIISGRNVQTIRYKMNND